jgi:CTP synthase (UTP-ammonia lyase)
MRLGRRTTHFVTDDSLVSMYEVLFIFLSDCRYILLEKLYGNVDTVDERHRHRYEVNPIYIEAFEEAGMKFVGRSDDNQRMEIVELESKLHKILI